jgi:hypothetical protein
MQPTERDTLVALLTELKTMLEEMNEGVQAMGTALQSEDTPPAAPETPQAPAEGADGGLVRKGGPDALEPRTVAQEQGPWEVWGTDPDDRDVVAVAESRAMPLKSRPGCGPLRFITRAEAEAEASKRAKDGWAWRVVEVEE